MEGRAVETIQIQETSHLEKAEVGRGGEESSKMSLNYTY